MMLSAQCCGHLLCVSCSADRRSVLAVDIVNDAASSIVEIVLLSVD